VATKGDGIGELAAALDRHRVFLEATGRLDARRRERLAARTRAVVDRSLRQWIWDDSPAEEMLARELDEMVAGHRSPYDVAAGILDFVKSGVAR
jgi:LAO/AO transport system kinase